LDEGELEEYVIDRNQSKENFFLFCQDVARPRVYYRVKNNPMNGEYVLEEIRREVRVI